MDVCVCVKYDLKRPPRFGLLNKTSLQEWWATLLWYLNKEKLPASRVIIDSYIKGDQKNLVWNSSVESSEVGLVLFLALIKNWSITCDY